MLVAKQWAYCFNFGGTESCGIVSRREFDPILLLLQLSAFGLRSYHSKEKGKSFNHMQNIWHNFSANQESLICVDLSHLRWLQFSWNLMQLGLWKVNVTGKASWFESITHGQDHRECGSVLKVDTDNSQVLQIKCLNHYPVAVGCRIFLLLHIRS